MAREIKKPSVILEKDLKEYAGPIEIDVTPKKEVKAQKLEMEEKPSIVPELTAIPKPPEVLPVAKMISFGAWFQKRSSSNPRLKLSYREAIEAHCKSIGIGPQASEEEYDAALSHFGL